MLPVLLILVLLILFISKNQANKEVGVLGYKTSFFHISSGQSKAMYEKIKKDGASPESLKEFIMLEDRLLRLEFVSVCTGVSHEYEAFAVSGKIKGLFTPYDFSYHAKHLKQVSEPHKLINKNITC